MHVSPELERLLIADLRSTEHLQATIQRTIEDLDQEKERLQHLLTDLQARGEELRAELFARYQKE